MGREIERKFLVRGDGWRRNSRGTSLSQGYLSVDPERTVRVRIAGEKAYLTVKGVRRGLSRAEFEYSVNPDEAREMLDTLCLKPLIEKTRYQCEVSGRLWEVDVFTGENEGLTVAEIELEDDDDVPDLPEWVGEEVTGDPRYENSSLVLHPFRKW